MIKQNKKLARAFIFDIDGTLAIRGDRDPFDYTRVGDDTLNKAVDICLYHLGEDYNIIICSGREGICKAETEQWLHSNKIYYSELHMRKEGDYRADYIVKEEMWREIIKDNYIVGMFDDRLQVINHARKLGFTVFDVAGNTF